MIPPDITPQQKKRRVSAAGLAVSLIFFALVVFALTRAEHRGGPVSNSTASKVKISTPAPAEPETVKTNALAGRPVAKPAPEPSQPVVKIEEKPEPAPVYTPRPAAAEKPRASSPAPTAKPRAARTATPATPRKKSAAAPANRPSIPYAPTVMPGRKKTPDTFVKIENAPPAAPGKDTPAWYSVRLNSSTNKNLADAVSTALRQRGFAGSETRAGSDGTYYVKVGDFSYRYSAEETKKQLQDLGFTDAHIEEKTVAK